MNTLTKKGILVVSFGTSYADTRKKTIEAIENDIAAAYPDCAIYRAFTSRMIIAKLARTENLSIMTVTEALSRMLQDGIEDVLVQPTHVINGHENDQMLKDLASFSSDFQSIHLGTPLLTSEEDLTSVMNAVGEEFSVYDPKTTAIVLMGHGTSHYANTVYAAMDYRFKDMGYPNVFLGTVEAYPSTESILRLLGKFKPDQIVLAPFMIVAGDHARNDLAGDDTDSWKSQFQKAGYPVIVSLKGLGEYPAIRQLFIEHVREAQPI